ncbi:hypothetical protein [Streptomyces sp. NPDC001927]
MDQVEGGAHLLDGVSSASRSSAGADRRSTWRTGTLMLAWTTSTGAWPSYSEVVRIASWRWTNASVARCGASRSSSPCSFEANWLPPES